ncbi:MAG: DUF2779 domain-containing protein [Bacilli bacterium]|nr:DUF2779 domain-containing protein [Bacilli bacterium]
MAITKTDFINYTRCARYTALEDIHGSKLTEDMSYEEYKEKEKFDQIRELYGEMFEDGVDLTRPENKQLEAMLPYYKLVEIEAGKIVKKYFGGTSVFAEETYDQKKFEFTQNEMKYLCYVDIYNEKENLVNIIEVKATTDKKYLDLEAGHPKKDKYSIFTFDKKTNCYYLKDEIENYPLEDEMPLKKYDEKKQKLFDRYSDVGTYVYDIAIQRFILEGEYKEKKQEEKLKNVRYYLGILNHQYTFEGIYENNEAIYEKDKKGNELIVFIDLTKVTEEYVKIIRNLATNLEKRLTNLDHNPCPLGAWCDRKGYKECPYFNTICGTKIPSSNSVLNYLNNPGGFTTEQGEKLKGLDLINAGYYNMLDIPGNWIKNRKHQIQREAISLNKVFIDKEKIQAGLNCLEYPIYHLDFETLPCPVPRFKGERPYMQSPFEFSLHIERAPGICDKEKDNITFLAKSFNQDEREELIKTLLEHVNPNEGTLFAQNVTFEKSRIKELANIFPKYKEPLMKLYNRGFDLMWLVNTKTDLYQKLGFDAERSALPNYYCKELSGSYSIKKTLPVFSDLSYKDLEVQNGTEAIVAYANYNFMTPEELEKCYASLRIYCGQDTWAMVVILNALRKLCQEDVKELTFA